MNNFSGWRFFWDMDGVLYDFDRLFREVMPGVDIENDDAWSWEQLHQKCPQMYLLGQDIPGSVQLFHDMAAHGENFILTAVPRRWSWPDVTKHKRTWATFHLDIHPEKVRFGPYAEDKQYHCLGPKDVLIDDRVRNIQQWECQGGTGIEFKSASQARKVLNNLLYPK